MWNATAVATTPVFLTGLIAFGAETYLFGSPLVGHLHDFSRQLPITVDQAQHGRGAVGRLAT